MILNYVLEKSRYYVEFTKKNENKSKDLWKVIYSERKDKSITMFPDGLNIDRDMYSTPEGIANNLNAFFLLTKLQ